MATGTQDPSGAPDGGRPRDAAETRRLLLEAARRRFAYDGYGATTSRDIAADAGVNVALINRYFASKEGLFEACLARTVEELDHPGERVLTLDDLVRALTEQATVPSDSVKPLRLLLLLRASGDERADLIRRRTMQSYTERMAAVSGWRADDPATAHLLVRAQIALALGFGMVVMRTSAELEPLASATPQQLEAPLRAVLGTLLPPVPDGGA